MGEDRDATEQAEDAKEDEGINDPLTQRDVEAPRTPFDGRPPTDE